jgi:fused signal recognition particle receptor
MMAFGWNKKKKEPEADGGKPQAPEQATGETPAETDARKVADTTEAGGADIPETTASTDQGEALAEGEKKTGFFKRLKKGLSKTRNVLNTDIEDLFTGKRKVDDELLEELEELLITADVGVKTAMELIERISKQKKDIHSAERLKEVLKEEIRSLLPENDASRQEGGVRPVPRVVMVIGVNGVGKTTTIGKLAAKAHAEGQKVLIAAADTFRAAASEQLEIWARRADAEIVKHRDGADPAAVAFDGVQAAMARGVDLVLIDTAGRLQTKVNLMEELKKIKRSVAKVMEEAPHEILLVLDATTGQNAVSQAKMFDEAMGIDTLALTKLDGTARGGIVISICAALNIPLTYVGVGERIEDLQDFDPVRFTDALF